MFSTQCFAQFLISYLKKNSVTKLLSPDDVPSHPFCFLQKIVGRQTTILCSVAYRRMDLKRD